MYLQTWIMEEKSDISRMDPSLRIFSHTKRKDMCQTQGIRFKQSGNTMRFKIPTTLVFSCFELDL